jgi:hypothetical protein
MQICIKWGWGSAQDWVDGEVSEDYRVHTGPPNLGRAAIRGEADCGHWMLKEPTLKNGVFTLTSQLVLRVL